MLRIVAMFLIVMYHYVLHSEMPFGSGNIWRDTFLQIFGFGGKIGVNIFVIISGYFLIYKNFSLHKLFKIMGTCWIYSFGFLCGIWLLQISDIIPIYTITYNAIIKSILPFGKLYWFAYTYILLYLATPFLNLLIKKYLLQWQKRYIILLVIGAFLLFFIPTVVNVISVKKVLVPSNLMIFVYLYCLGAYLKLYMVKIKDAYLQLGIVSLLILDLVCTVMLYQFSFYYPVLENDPMYFTSRFSVFSFLLAVNIFLYFQVLRITYSRRINIIASTTFGIYLIHDNSLFRVYLWHDLLHTKMFYNSDYFVFYSIVVVAGVFCLSSILDSFRLYLLKQHKPYWVDLFFCRLDDEVMHRVNNLTMRLFNKS